MVERNEQGEPEKVGYKRPPKENQFKPGQRGNPKGRPRGSRNLKTIVEESLTKTISVRRGNKTEKVPIVEVITDTFALKAAQGDVKAAGVVINFATKVGLLGGRNDATQTAGTERVVPAATSARPSGALVESVDPDLLSRDEQIDLAQIAERIDAGGDVIALSADDFARFKEIMNKGRGKNVVPQADDDLEQAA